MKFHVITSAPEHFEGFINTSIIGRAQKEGVIDINIVNIRDYSKDKHKCIDDVPFGGGPGMVLQAEPILLAAEDVKKNHLRGDKVKIVLFSPRGESFVQEKAREYSENYTDIIMICGRYEGIDERVIEIVKPEQVSVGEYVLTGGEIPAMIIIDAVSRNIEGVLGKQESLEDQRITNGKVYTRPAKLEWEDEVYEVPEVLLSGHHKNIEEWRKI
jgi:tRNA (guanine37-N1)-methyltransferase